MRVVLGTFFEWCTEVLFTTHQTTPTKRPYDLLAFCQRQQIAPLLYERSKSLDNADDIPWDLIGGLEAASIEQWQLSNRLRFELNRVAGLLSDATIDWVLLKGLDLSQRFYGSLSARAYSDLDILVHADDLGPATRCLTGADYERRSSRLDGSGPWRRALRRNLHHVELSRGRVNVEVHHNLRSHPTFRIAEATLWSGIQGSDVVKGGCSVLSDENALLTMLLALHADIELGVATMKNLVDVDTVLSRVDSTTDWTAFLAKREEEGTLKIVVNGIDLTRRLLGGEGRYPAVAATLRGNATIAALLLSPIAPTVNDEFLTLFDFRELSPQAARRSLSRCKIWAHRQYRGGVAMSLLNWAASLPLRIHGTARPFENLGRRQAGLDAEKRGADRRDRP